RGKPPGLLPGSPESIETLDVRTVRAVLKEAAAAGVARQALAEADSRDERDADAWVNVLVHANVALADSPIPERTWPGLADLLGIDLLAKLVGIAPASARRYLAGDRPTPDVVAARLHWIRFFAGAPRGLCNY